MLHIIAGVDPIASHSHGLTRLAPSSTTTGTRLEVSWVRFFILTVSEYGTVPNIWILKHFQFVYCQLNFWNKISRVGKGVRARTTVREAWVRKLGKPIKRAYPYISATNRPQKPIKRPNQSRKNPRPSFCIPFLFINFPIYKLPSWMKKLKLTFQLIL